MYLLILITFPGDYSEEVTPVPIPNTEVKGLSGEGTAALGCGRVARCQDFSFDPDTTIGVFFCNFSKKYFMVGKISQPPVKWTSVPFSVSEEIHRK